MNMMIILINSPLLLIEPGIESFGGRDFRCFGFRLTKYIMIVLLKQKSYVTIYFRHIMSGYLQMVKNLILSKIRNNKLNNCCGKSDQTPLPHITHHRIIATTDNISTMWAGSSPIRNRLSAL